MLRSRKQGRPPRPAGRAGGSHGCRLRTCRTHLRLPRGASTWRVYSSCTVQAPPNGPWTRRCAPKPAVPYWAGPIPATRTRCVACNSRPNDHAASPCCSAVAGRADLLAGRTAAGPARCDRNGLQVRIVKSRGGRPAASRWATEMAPLARRRVTPAFRPSCTPSPGQPLAARSRELWLAVHLPALMLDSLREAVQALAASTHRSPSWIWNATARSCVPARAGVHEAGVRNGMSVNAALALVPTLQTLARDPRRERRLLDVLARRGLHFTPRVSLEPPDGVLLEVRGSLRLFGGARQLCTRLQQEIVPPGGLGAFCHYAGATRCAVVRAAVGGHLTAHLRAQSRRAHGSPGPLAARLRALARAHRPGPRHDGCAHRGRMPAVAT